MKTRLKDNIMLIILCIVIIWCTLEILGELERIGRDTAQLSDDLFKIRRGY